MWFEVVTGDTVIGVFYNHNEAVEFRSRVAKGLYPFIRDREEDRGERRNYIWGVEASLRRRLRGETRTR